MPCRLSGMVTYIASATDSHMHAAVYSACLLEDLLQVLLCINYIFQQLVNRVDRKAALDCLPCASVSPRVRKCMKELELAGSELTALLQTPCFRSDSFLLDPPANECGVAPTS